jgi:hypothetical protein
MTNGKQVYNGIQSEVDRLDRAKFTIESELRKNQRDQQYTESKRLECLTVIAQVHVNALLDQGTTGHGEVKAVSMEIEGLIRKRNAAYKQVLSTIDEGRTALRLADEAVTSAESNFEAVRVKVYADLAQSSDVANKRALSDEADRTVFKADELVAEVTDEATEKLLPYRNSPIFQHLLARQFCTDTYQGSGLFARLDRWLAKKIDYTQAVHDFSVMNQLPALAAQKAQDARTAQSRANDEYKVLEQQARHRYNIDGAEKAVKDAKAQRELCRERIGLDQRAMVDYTSKTDPMMATINKRVRDLMGQFSIDTLDRLTRATVDDADELALRQYRELSNELPGLMGREQELQRQLDQAAQDFRKVKTLRDRFSSQNYDSSNRKFDSDFDLNAVLTGYMLGQISQNDFDRNCERNSTVVRESSSYDYNGNSGNNGNNGFSGGSSFGGSDTKSNYSTPDSIGGGGGGSDSGSFSTGDSF